jgi:hydrogenase maturation protease
MATRDGRTLVLGIGNVLMGDEGVGVHAVRSLQNSPIPDGVDVIDGGTGGFHLLSFFEDYASIIMIDATMDGQAPGTVRTLKPRFASDYPRTLSAHDIGLRDLVETAALLEHRPDVTLVTISIDSMQPMQMQLSDPIAGAIPAVMRVVQTLLGNKGTESRR